ncbi:MAG: hypothetical protein JW846_03270 [Dehalococcoidia bacterium]|nr:hypothetical protein [Dehalococcoidia bacterium]
MRSRVSKVGMLMLALVFAVGTMGAAFASWTDQVSIEGEVTTGSLGYEICGFSETWVYKVLQQYEFDDETYEPGDVLVSPEELDVSADILLPVASADWTGQLPGMLDEGNCIQGKGQSFEVKFNNLFPCVWFKADIVLHYIGSVPAKLSPTMEFGDESEWLAALWNMTSAPEFYMVAYKWEDAAGTTPGWVMVDLEGLQLEYCDRVMIEWWIHVPQDNTLMNKTGGFTTTINMVQWNEYPLID